MGFENLPAIAAGLRDVEDQAWRTGKAIRDIPIYRSEIEPSSSRNVQDLSAVPPGFVRSPTGGLLPAGGGTSQVPASALPVSPGIYIPPDYSEGARQRREQRAGAWNEAAAAQVIAQLKELIARLTEVFGGPTYVGMIIEQEIRNLEAKVVTPDEALTFIRYILSTMYAGLQQEAMSPVASIRSIASDMMRFAGGAALPDSERDLPGVRGLAPPAEAQGAGRHVSAGRETTAGFAGAVREGFAALSSTVTRHNEQQADRVITAGRTQATEARTAAERNSRATTEWQRSIEGTYLRPLRANMFSPRELSDAFHAALASRRV